MNRFLAAVWALALCVNAAFSSPVCPTGSDLPIVGLVSLVECVGRTGSSELDPQALRVKAASEAAVFQYNTTANAAVQGFTLTNGHVKVNAKAAKGEGGAVYSADSSTLDGVSVDERKPSTALYEGFRSPPEDCRPGIWLMRFREETPDAVITYDLEHLAAAGIGEFCIYGYGNTSKKNAYGSLVLMDRPGVVAKLRKALSESARLGLKMSICIGPAGCGNERTSPDNAMKVLADSRKVVEGGRHVKVRLPRCKVSDSPVDEAGLPKYWHDIGVFAVGPRVVEIKERFDVTGETVDWEAPSGSWTLVRIAWVPKMFGWVGSYIDPLSREALDEHWGYCVAPLLNAATPAERRAFKGVLCDSWEGGDVSWTQCLPEEFRRRRGYPVAEALVAKVGLTVGDEARTVALRRDFDETIGELFAENHYAYQKELANRHGLVSEAEACGPHQHHGDSRRMQGRCDLCTGEFWMPSPHRPSDSQRFMLRDSATAAHVYGAKEVRAEAFTTMGTHWLESPVQLKPCADRAFCDGLTKVVWHGMLMSDDPDDLPGDTRRAGAYYSPARAIFQRNSAGFECERDAG